MAVLESGRFQEDDLGKIAGVERGPEVLDVVLMVGLIAGVADQSCRGRRQVRRIGR